MREQLFDGFDLTHWSAHALSVLAMTGSIFGYIPAIAGLVALVWYIIQIWESKTFQSWLLRRRSNLAFRHIQSLRRRQKRAKVLLDQLEVLLVAYEQPENPSPAD